MGAIEPGLTVTALAAGINSLAMGLVFQLKFLLGLIQQLKASLKEGRAVSAKGLPGSRLTPRLAVALILAHPLFLLPAPGLVAQQVCPSEIGFDEPIQCSIDKPGEERRHTFRAARGERVKIRLTVRNLSPHSDVLRSDGTRECGPGYGDIDDCPLDASGLHTILVKDEYESKTGTYVLTLEHLESSSTTRPENGGPPPRGGGGGLDATQITVAVIGALGTVLAAVLAAAYSARRRARGRDQSSLSR